MLYVSAEDPRNEVHYRLEQMNRHAQISSDKLTGLKIIDLTPKDDTDRDTVLATFDKKGMIKPTDVLTRIEQTARQYAVRCIIFDALADFFGGNENDRAEVRAFIRLLRGLAIRLDVAVILIAHPSVDGIKTNRGYSGSTHWNNGIRSRWNFTSVEASPDEPPDPDLRVLELAKANRARRGEKIYMRWEEGRFVQTDRSLPSNSVNDQNAEKIFLQLVDQFEAEGHHVSNTKARPMHQRSSLSAQRGKKSASRRSNEPCIDCSNRARSR